VTITVENKCIAYADDSADAAGNSGQALAHSIALCAEGFTNVIVTSKDGAAVVATYDGSVIDVRFTSPVAAGATRQIDVAYSIVDPVCGLLFGPPGAATPTYVVSDHETEKARCEFFFLKCSLLRFR
jgi:hypothetical protein